MQPRYDCLKCPAYCCSYDEIAVGQRDIPMIVGVVLVAATGVVLANLLVDLLYPLLDPRIRLARQSPA